MRRNPIYVFDDRSSKGIDQVPLGSIIQILDAGTGDPTIVQLKSATGLTATTTIGDFLDSGDAVDLDSDTLSELEKVGDGWRLLGKNSAMYSTPGVNAVDLSTSEVVGNYGAGGIASFAVGTGTRAQNPNSVGMGIYNVGTSASTLLEIGSGTYAAPKNILEVFEEGTVVTPNTSAAEIDNAGPKTLTTVEYVQGRVTAEFPSKTTDDLAEASNLYYTSSRDTANFNTNIVLQNISVLTDVDTTTTTPATGQVLKWNGVKWIPENDLHEVTSVNTQIGDVILDTDDIAEGVNNKYYTEARFGNSFSGKFTDDLPEGAKKFYDSSVAQDDADIRILASPLATLFDVVSTTAVSGDILTHNGSAWGPGTVNVGVTSVNTQTGDVTLILDNLDDVNVTGALNTQVLSFDTAANKWKAATVTNTTYALANTTADGLMPSVDFNKLAGVEALATADQTGSEIKASYEAETDTNVYDDAAVNSVGTIALKANIADPTFTGTTTANALTVTNTTTVDTLTATSIIANGPLGVVGVTTVDDLIINGALTGPAASTSDAGLMVQGGAVTDSSGTDAAANAATINALLASLRAAGIIA